MIRHVLLATAFAVTATATLAEEQEIGAEEFQRSCAVCHGEGGRGDGSMAAILKVPPADLTVLSKNNGGTFPLRGAFETIDGRNNVRGHGDREMPIWGNTYKFEADSRFGPDFGEWEAVARMLALVFYLQTIQEE